MSETKNKDQREGESAPSASGCSCGADIKSVLSVMLIEVSDAKEACNRMAGKQADEGMKLYHDGQADAYRMVKRGLEKRLAGSAPAIKSDAIQKCQDNAIKILNMANDIGCFSYNEQERLTRLAREIFNLLEATKTAT